MKAEFRMVGGGQLFIDALSEPFEPITDQNGAAHTLNRLAYATRTKGEETSVHGDIAGTWEYSPSWGGGALATALYLRQNYSAAEMLVGVKLEADERTRLEVRSASIFGLHGDASDDDMLVRFETPTAVFDKAFELELGEKLTAARLVIAQYSADFFSQIS